MNFEAMFGLAGRRAIVTGGASGIGLGIARTFAAAGASVVIAGRRADVGEAAAAAVQAEGGDARFIRTDVRDVESVRALFAACEGVGVLVNAAGGADPPRSPSTATPTSTRCSRSICAVCSIAAAKAIPRFAARGGGAIVNIASYLGYRGGPGWAPVYSAAKGGVVSVTRSLAVAHGPQGVRVNAICPGFVATALVDDLLAHTPNPAATLRRVAMEYPLRRTGTPEDIAQAALFLASPAAAWVTGVVLPVDGGVTAK